MTLRASIVGGSGYAGGELLRLLLGHPGFEVAQVTSRRLAGSFVHFTHPNLRGHSDLRFSTVDELERCDLLFLCLPHGNAARDIDLYSELVPKVVDLSADFRLRSAEAWENWYGDPHVAPGWLDRFVYGLPELDREAVAGADLASGVGCNATATLLGLLPLLEPATLENDLVDWSRGVVTELKVGSSEGGASSSDASHHPERSGVVRSFRPTGHRHTAEVEQAFASRGVDVAGDVHLSVTAVEMVRGVLATSHIFLADATDKRAAERELFRTYRSFCRQHPFVRLVKDRRGIHRYPEPKILAGSNHAEVGFDLDPRTGRLVVICAIDNLMKGAAGNAVQCANLMCGYGETQGLDFLGLHPV